MKKKLVIIVFLTTLLPFQGAVGESISSGVLETENAKLLTQQCSRDAPENIEGVWIPLISDIAELEKHIHLLKEMESTVCCGSGKIERNLTEYHLQYAGIIVGGRKLIYINAFLKKGMKEDEKHEPVIICDGGKSLWGAIYDPSKRTFNSLAFNGEA